MLRDDLIKMAGRFKELMPRKVALAAELVSEVVKVVRKRKRKKNEADTKNS